MIKDFDTGEVKSAKVVGKIETCPNGYKALIQVDGEVEQVRVSTEWLEDHLVKEVK